MSDKFVDKFNIMGIPVQIKDKNLTDIVNNTLTPKVTTLEGRFPVSGNNIADCAITTNKIADLSIVHEKIGPDAVAIDKLAPQERMSVRIGSASLTKRVVMIGDSYVHSAELWCIAQVGQMCVVCSVWSHNPRLRARQP